ncbi:MAG: hypothetical protein IPJ73_03290 [Zoogloea sp.]|nr:hypothetical protein [Zoogloea sp.]
MAGCLQARCCSLALLDPVAEGLGVPAQLGAPRLARLLDEFDAEALARGGGLRRSVSGPAGEMVELAVPVRDADNIYGVLIVEAPGNSSSRAATAAWWMRLPGCLPCPLATCSATSAAVAWP